MAGVEVLLASAGLGDDIEPSGQGVGCGGEGCRREGRLSELRCRAVDGEVELLSPEETRSAGRHRSEVGEDIRREEVGLRCAREVDGGTVELEILLRAGAAAAGGVLHGSGDVLDQGGLEDGGGEDEVEAEDGVADVDQLLLVEGAERDGAIGNSRRATAGRRVRRGVYGHYERSDRDERVDQTR